MNAIKGSGFVDVKVVGESAYPIGSLLDLPDMKEKMKKWKLSREGAEAYAENVVSIKVSGVKKQQLMKKA